MEIFLEFLKYGAIGIAMVLVVLSYRLLSKEQDREMVREPMLKSIKSYITLALIITAFFGITEIVSLTISNKSDSVGLNTEIERVYKRNFKDGTDKSVEEKLAAIDESLRDGKKSINTEDQDKEKEIAELEKIIQQANFGEYVDVVLQIKDSIDQSKRNFINLTHNEESKSHYYQMLGKILSYLKLFDASEKSSNAQILAKWAELKRTYAYLGNENTNRVEWIVGSDISQLLKIGHN